MGCGGYTQPWSLPGTTAEPWRQLERPSGPLLECEKSPLGAGRGGQMGRRAVRLPRLSKNIRECKVGGSHPPPRGLISTAASPAARAVEEPSLLTRPQHPTALSWLWP